ncbi:MAG: tetratricopeptide repeat protein [Candidatus Peribacteraceae bacterium]|jgi:tetratricopeptide (TPR) repeat protein
MKVARVLLPLALALLLVAGLLAYLWLNLGSAAQAFRMRPQRNPLTANLQGLSMEGEEETGGAALTHVREGDSRALAGDWKGAQEAYEAAVAADGGVTALKKLALAQLQRRDTKAVSNTIERLRREGARAEDLLLLSTTLALHQENLPRAQELLAKAGESPHRHYGSALLAIVQGEHPQAQAELRLTLDGWDPVLRTYARTLLDAYEEFALFPQSPPIHLSTLLSRSLAQVQECALALPLLGRVTAEQDDYRDAWIVQGYCQLITERTQEALASFERSYTLDPQKPEIQYFLGRTYGAMEDHKNALTFLQYALTNGFKPEKDVRRAIATEAEKAGDVQLAFEQEKILATASGTDLASITAFVDLALRAQRQEDAFEAAERATLRWPESAAAYALLGSAAEAAGKTEEARAAYGRALELDGTLDDVKGKLLNL